MNDNNYDPKTTNSKDVSHSDVTSEFLAGFQGHWLEKLALPLLAVAFSWTAMFLARTFLSFFYPDLTIPVGVLFLGFVVALVRVYLANLFRRGNAPVIVSAAMLLLTILVTYVVVRLTSHSPYPLLSLSAFKDQMVLASLGVVLLGRYLSGSSGVMFALIGNIADEMGDQAVITMSWEQEALFRHTRVEGSRITAVEWATRRVLLMVFVTCILSIRAIEALPVRFASSPLWAWSITLGTLGLLFFGFALQGTAHLYRIKTIWKETGTKVNADLPKQWFVNTLIWSLAIILVALVLPGNISPLSYRHIIALIVAIMSRTTNLELEDEQRRREAPPPTPHGEQGPTPELQEPSWFAAILTLLYLALPVILGISFLLLIVGFVLVTFFKSEKERFKGLARIPVICYLWFVRTLKMLGLYWQTTLEWGQRQLDSYRTSSLQAKLESQPAYEGESEGPIPSAPAMYIRRLFKLLIRDASRHGISPRDGQTPNEYVKDLQASLEESDEELKVILDRYNEARYSHHSLSDSIKPLVQSAWERVTRTIKEKLGKG